jgi:ssDNA-binding Zn-finger/Zn-ribbon topoisomerase 1
MTKPCELSCPKCGATGVARQYREKGQMWSTHKYGKRSQYASGPGTYALTADRDHIEHECLTCHHEWQTLPLAESRTASTRGVK